jgi:hypothetical protein
LKGEDIIKECTELQIEAFASTGSTQANLAFQALLIAAIDNLTSEVRDLKNCLKVPAHIELDLTNRQEQN